MKPFELTEELAEKCCRLALDCVDREYPNHIQHVLSKPDDVGTPAQLTPIFYGCFDWHSAVHSHWSLLRIARTFPGLEVSRSAMNVLGRHFTEDKVHGEIAYLSHPDRTGFERPYGLAWLLQLCAELQEWKIAETIRWTSSLEPLAELVVERLTSWLPKLMAPIRSGEHSQTAFALGLVWDWATTLDRREVLELLHQRIRDFYLQDRNAPVAYEPSGHDFLSPTLAEADFMRRVLPQSEFADWLTDFLPCLTDGTVPYSVQTVTDAADGKLSHLDGLNLSRAWMLQGIVHALPQKDARRQPLADAAKTHADAGLQSLTGHHYAGGHWLGSFAVYLLTNRGLNTDQAS
ncbi:DUF2891 domain-containing protein [Thalassoroseus pseudoceratinae]|uniref:DUF2891 domain-containing protein n=1 Tax=Thalassoroseus pseudoceratinae TaxID=2713176 RepID=UPI00197E3361|nr:DUF2891 domain-containing protein [Thalassoroseus pseudoceratinae]